MTPDEIKNLIREAGITCSVVPFPTQVKLSPPPEKVCRYNHSKSAECEPYITADHRLLLERPEDVILGLEAIMKATGVKKSFIGIENNKPDAVDSVNKALGNREDVEVVVLGTKYPQGGEKQLIKAVTDREVPSGGLPMDVGVIVNNAGTCAAIANVLKTGLPLIERITTVTGSGIKEPKNLLIRIGTPLADIIEQLVGLKGIG